MQFRKNKRNRRTGRYMSALYDGFFIEKRGKLDRLLIYNKYYLKIRFAY